MNAPKPAFSVKANVANPGQFFACCGILELAHRLWPGAEGWFEDNAFRVAARNCKHGLAGLVDWLHGAQFRADGAGTDDKICPLRLHHDNDAASPAAHPPLRLDWWLDQAGIGGSLKTWAGQQGVTVISRAMLDTAVAGEAAGDTWLDQGAVARVEPFYFDARRYAHALDVGFSIDASGAQAVAYPPVELMALIGLQRFRPRPAEGDRWTFEYFAWNQPLGVTAAVVACGAVPVAGRRGFRFRLQFRDDQKRYKAFGFANQIGGNT